MNIKIMVSLWYIMVFDKCILCLGNLVEVGLGFY